jgi:hypothetical protein
LDIVDSSFAFHMRTMWGHLSCLHVGWDLAAVSAKGHCLCLSSSVKYAS